MASKKLPAKPTMAQAFNAAQGPAVNRPKSSGPIEYPKAEGASPKARRTQSARMTGQANRGSATENLAKRIKTDAARKKSVADWKRDTTRKDVTAGSNVLSKKAWGKAFEVVKAQVSPNASAKNVKDVYGRTRTIVTKKYTGAGSQASKKKK